MPATKLRRSSTETKESNNHAENRLLAALSRKDFRLLLPDFETVALPLNEIFTDAATLFDTFIFRLTALFFCFRKSKKTLRLWKLVSSETKEWRASPFFSALGNHVTK